MARRPIPFPSRPPLQQEEGIDWPVELERAPYREPGRKQLLDQTDTGNIGRSVQVPTLQTVVAPDGTIVNVATASDSPEESPVEEPRRGGRRNR